jgi:type II secretory pathway predicted ATPase ExeA
MYCDYWNLHKAPFDNVPDPSMYVDCHVSMENVISETIFAIKEANEAFAVIIGDVGLGKTLSLRIIMDSLDPDKYKMVLITNPSISFTQLMREIIGQITGHQCDEKRKLEQLEIFNRLLFETTDQGQKIVIFIDEANSLSLANLENLRLLTNMQDDQRNLFTLVLAGQMELAQRLEHPKRTNLFQRIGTYGRIDKLPSEDTVKTYIETRLKHAGTQTKIFSDDCFPVIWEYSEHGVPRLINKICKLSLKAGETNGFNIILADVVTQVAERFQKLSKTAFQKRKSRNRLDRELTPGEISILVNVEEFPETIQDTSEKIVAPLIKSVTADVYEIKPAELLIAAPPFELTNIKEIVDDSLIKIDTSISFNHPQQRSISGSEVMNAPAETFNIHIESKPETVSIESKPELSRTEFLENIIESRVDYAISETETNIELMSNDIMPRTEFSPVDKPVPAVHVESTQVIFISETQKETASPGFESFEVAETDKELQAHEEVKDKPQKTEHASKEEYDEVIIGNYKILLTIPKDIIKQVKSFNHQSANKSAGYWAAQIIKKNPQLTHSPHADPVALWYEIKDNILKKISV